MKVAVLGSTSGSDLAGIFGAMDAGKLPGIDIVLVLSNKKSASILERAKQRGIKALFVDPREDPREVYDRRISGALTEEGAELVLLIGYMRFLSPGFVRQWWGRCLNVHPSLLPKFAGGMDLNVHAAVIAAHERETGATIHFVDEGADSGPIVWQKSVKIAKDETPETLKPKVQALEVEGFVEVLGKMRDGRIRLDGKRVTFS